MRGQMCRVFTEPENINYSINTTCGLWWVLTVKTVTETSQELQLALGVTMSWRIKVFPATKPPSEPHKCADGELGASRAPCRAQDNPVV